MLVCIGILPLQWSPVCHDRLLLLVIRTSVTPRKNYTHQIFRSIVHRMLLPDASTILVAMNHSLVLIASGLLRSAHTPNQKPCKYLQGFCLSGKMELLRAGPLLWRIRLPQKEAAAKTTVRRVKTSAPSWRWSRKRKGPNACRCFSWLLLLRIVP